MGYGHVDTVCTAGDRGRNWNIGLSAPLGVFTAKLGYYRSEAEGSGAKGRKIGLGGDYGLSKRTYPYTSYGRAKKDGSAVAIGFDVGISHAF